MPWYNRADGVILVTIILTVCVSLLVVVFTEKPENWPEDMIEAFFGLLTIASAIIMYHVKKAQ